MLGDKEKVSHSQHEAGDGLQAVALKIFWENCPDDTRTSATENWRCFFK